MNSKKVGSFGEKIAENYLKNKGYQILDRNYFFRIPGNPQRGEIDIIAQKNGIISFIEVKTLRNPDWLIRPARLNFARQNFCGPARLNFARQNFGGPEEKVNFSKQRKLVKTAESWLMKKKIPLNSKWQIDVMAIEMKNKKVKISHFENAIPYC